MAPRITDPEQLKEVLGIPFTSEQIAAITAPMTPNVIVAGAGSGKTTVMAARVVWLAGTGQVRPESVLGLTFTNKAAGELAERVRKALLKAGITDPDPDLAAEEEPPGEPEISTYHAFAGRLLKEHGLRIGIEPGARLLADATRYQLSARVLRRATGPYPSLTRPFADLVSDLLALDSELSEHLVTPPQLREYDSALAAELAQLDPARRGCSWAKDVLPKVRARLELTELVEAYRQEKRDRGDLLDFGDQIAFAAILAQRRREVGRILREQFAVVLLDEYQDTSVAQRLLLAHLFGAAGGAGQGHPVTAVGDPCQAIYGWRGASVANLDDFPEHFPHVDGRPADRYSLSENRRSGGRLLGLANRISEPLRQRHQGVAALRPAPGAERDGMVRCALLTTHDEEISWLADSIAHLVRTGTPPGSIAILCRAGKDFPDIHAALVARDVPVEVVGLSGLLHLPEVADLVATCEVLQDPTANAALVRLLAGPRWRIGHRDLALLGRLARQLVSVQARRPEAADDPDGKLVGAVEGTDPTELVSLADALDTFLGAAALPPASLPQTAGDLPFSPEARVRFARLAAEIRDLRRSLGDPLMDVLHRVLAVTGLEVELSASPQALAAQRRETLRSFLDTAASFADLDGDPSLSAFLGFLRTAAHYDKGLDNTLPGGENTVKVLTAHKAKGLEWDVVAVPGLVARQFPSEQGRSLWTRNPAVLPHALRGDAATLPDVTEWSRKGLRDFATRMKEHQFIEELRLGYVAFTRPRSLLLGSGHWWGPSQAKRRGPSVFLEALREHCEAGSYGEVEAWADPPAEDAGNPALTRTADHVWPLPLDEAATERRRQAARTVLSLLGGEPQPDPATPLMPEDARAVASWDRDLDALTGELLHARRAVRDVPLPASLSASQLLRLAAAPDAFARELARPMPRPPQPAARRGTRFHAWVESLFEPLPLIEPDELPGAEDAEIADEHDLRLLKEAFLRTPYADRTPFRVEAPFQLVLAGRVIRGRIDAVYKEGDGYEVVDWKTNRVTTADPLQLAVYRLAWAERQRVPPEQVTAAFLYVRTGEVVRPADLPGRSALERILTSGGDVGSPP